VQVLIVGAGAVGAVYGRHLQQGGARVTFRVREAYADQVRGGVPLAQLNRGTSIERLTGCSVITTDAEVAAHPWDAVLLAISATALRGDWRAPFLAACGASPVVLLQPGHDERALVTDALPPEQVGSGLISFIAYQAPLPGEERFREPCIAYWLPPLLRAPFEGAAAAELASVLTAGGMPARVQSGVAEQEAWASVVLSCHIAVLEAAGWSLDEVRRGDWRRLAADASAEGLAITARQLGRRVPLGARLVGPLASGLASRLAPWVLPLPVEAYLQVHFTKVGDQTRAQLDGLIRSGQREGLPVTCLDRLLGHLERDGAASPT
jgi:2-dehydropantoate 2-reductase